MFKVPYKGDPMGYKITYGYAPGVLKTFKVP